MTDDSIELVDRVVSALEEYFGEVTDDRLLSMIVNPHLAINGFEDLKKLEGEKGDELFDRAKKLLKKNMIRLAKPVERGIDLDANNTEGTYIRLYLNRGGFCMQPLFLTTRI